MYADSEQMASEEKKVPKEAQETYAVKVDIPDLPHVGVPQSTTRWVVTPHCQHLDRIQLANALEIHRPGSTDEHRLLGPGKH